MLVRVSAPSAVGGVIAAPPSKSMAHRAALCAALAKGRSLISNLEYSKDISATLAAARQLCAEVGEGKTSAEISGLGRFKPVAAPIDCCESGSTLRFLIPLASLTGQRVSFIGRGRLMERPQSVYAKLFSERGLLFEQSAEGITIEGALSGGAYRLAGDISSQFISGLLFALPLAEKDSVLELIPPIESRSYIDMTRAVQRRFGVKSEWLSENSLKIAGGQSYSPCDYTVEGDYSQGAFAAVLGAVRGNISVSGLAADTLQGDAAVLDILARCGATFERRGDTVSFKKAPLRGTKIDLADCPDLGPVLMVLGLFCEGETEIYNAERLRLKESDRIAAMESEIRAAGGLIESSGGTVKIKYSADRLHKSAAPLSSHNDHRVAMSLAVLASAAGLALEIDGAESVEKSWPSFWREIPRLGAEVSYA